MGTAPPQPVELTLKVRRDARTEIPLRVYSLANEPLKYLIRVPPEHGRLSEPRQTEREVAVVVYEPPADLAITTDKFSYAVQNSIGVSAAVEVSITIVDQQPQLSFPDTLDFSTIRAGSTNFRMLEITNHGGQIATGEVIVDAPWRIVGKTGYRLRTGDTAIFKIIFAPDAGGLFEGVARFTSEPRHSTTLRGESEAAISANPARWVLQQTPGDPVRSGSFELSNQLDDSRTLNLKTDPRLKIPAEMTLAGHGKATIFVEASPRDVQGFDTEIHLEAPDISIAIPIHVPTLDAVVRPTAPAVIFGRLPTGPDATAQFELENIGGAPGTVSWEISPPFSVTEFSATLQPGEKKSFTIGLDTKVPNRYRTWLQFKIGAQSFDLPVQAEVIGAQMPIPGLASKPRTNNNAPPPGPVTPIPKEPSAAVLALRAYLPPELVPILPPPKGVQVNRLTPTSATIEWPASLSTATHFRVEMRHLGPGSDHRLQVTWQPSSGIAMENRGSTYAVVLKGLQPAQPCAVRVFPQPATDAGTKPLFTVSFITPQSTSLFSFRKISPLQWLLIAFFGLLAWQAWQRWRQRSIF